MTGRVASMHFGEPFGGIVQGAPGRVLSILLRTGTPLTGRHIHRLVADAYSLWSVQEALKSLRSLGLIKSTSVGVAELHAVNEEHVAIPPLRVLVDPMFALKEVIAATVGDKVDSVILFGSIARGESTAKSDVDLAVIARHDWDGRTVVADAVRTRIGNHCDVIVLTEAEFLDRAESGEPVVADIIRDGVALLGSKPRIRRRVRGGVA